MLCLPLSILTADARESLRNYCITPRFHGVHVENKASHTRVIYEVIFDLNSRSYQTLLLLDLKL